MSVTQVYVAAPPSGVTLLLPSDLTVATAFADGHPQLFREKTARVVHMGGAVVTERRRREKILGRGAESPSASFGGGPADEGAAGAVPSEASTKLGVGCEAHHHHRHHHHHNHH